MKNNRGLMRATAVGAVASMTLVAAPALAAKPIKPGAVTNLTFSASAPAYHLASTWSAGRNATAYQVRLTNAAGTTLDSERVSTLSWSFDVTPKQAPMGTSLRLSVTSYNGKQKSAAVSKSVVMPDVTPPAGAYSATSNVYTATVTQDSLSDDSGAAGVSRTVHWGDGSASTAWTTGSTIKHTYPAQGTYNGFVRLRDAAGNFYDAPFTVTIADLNAPSGGKYTASSDSHKATIEQVTAPTDDFDGTNVARTVTWGDGSADSTWASGSKISHSYADQGSYTAVVHVADSSGHSTDYSVPVEIKDTAAPTGSYTASWQDWVGTITESVAPTDDFDATADVTRTIDWGDGTSAAPDAEAWVGGSSSMTHTYATEGRYVATVTLTDKAGNAQPYQLPIVIQDVAQPQATYSVTSPTRSVWAKYTKITLDQALVGSDTSVDNMSPDGFVKRSVAWGDGKVTNDTAASGSPTHRYATAGNFVPKVTLTDESGNTQTFAAPVVKVKADTVAPRVTNKLPAKPRYFVKKWHTLRGAARDYGVGVKVVRLQVVEKRHGVYYAYRFSTHRWVKAGSHIGAAWKKAARVTLRPTATHTWSRRVFGLQKGVLVHRVDGVDRLGNVSRWLTHSQKLTRR